MPCHKGLTGNIYTKSNKAPALKRGFASYIWNMSKAVAKKEKRKNSPALKEYIHGVNLPNSKIHIQECLSPLTYQ